MNRAFKISLVANLGLAALVFWLMQRPRVSTDVVAPSAANAAEESGPPVSRPTSFSSTAVECPQKFRWGQLESTDYRTYIANLRAIGCPAQTIRDIITADVDSVFAGRRGSLMRQQVAGQGGALGTQQAMQTGLQQLQNEEAAVLLALLGPPAGSNAPTAAVAEAPAAPPATIARRSRFQPEQKVALPLVFQDPGPEMKLSPAQRAVINDVRESFNQELGGLNLDPASPEYRQAWLKAQREADDALSAMLGSYFALDYQMKAEDQAPATK